jgi:ABC-type multidrug transport system ATPase subunit
MSEIILQTHNLTKHYGDVVAAREVNLQVNQGEIFGFLGPNGAGKTTTIGMALGLIHPTAGRIELFGQPVSPDHTRPLRQVGSLVGTPALLPYLSGRDNLRLLARLHPNVDNQRIEEVLALVDMTEAAGRKTKGYSTGMKQRLGLAAALLHRPSLVILDEPTNGLDPAGMRDVRNLLRSLSDSGVTIFLSSHLLHEVEQVCDRIAVINQGRIVTQGLVSDLLAQREQVVKVRVPSPAEARRVLENVPGVGRIESNGNYIEISGLSSETIVAQLTSNGIIPGEVAVQKSDLESLFLSLTTDQEA